MVPQCYMLLYPSVYGLQLPNVLPDLFCFVIHIYKNM